MTYPKFVDLVHRLRDAQRRADDLVDRGRPVPMDLFAELERLTAEVDAVVYSAREPARPGPYPAELLGLVVRVRDLTAIKFGPYPVCRNSPAERAVDAAVRDYRLGLSPL